MKLIVEMEMNGIPDCCGLCDPLLTAVCATKHDQAIDKMLLRVGRPSWCPIKGELPDEHGDLIDRDALRKCGMMYRSGIDEDGLIYVPLRDVMKSISNAPTVIAAERKDDEHKGE